MKIEKISTVGVCFCFLKI